MQIRGYVFRTRARVYVPAKISFHGTHVTGDNFDIVIDMLMHVLSNITLHRVYNRGSRPLPLIKALKLQLQSDT